MKKIAEVIVISLGFFSCWIWVAFLGINAMASKPIGYVVGQVCIWDAVVLAVILVLGGSWSYRWKESTRSIGILITSFSYIGLFCYLFFAGHPANQKRQGHRQPTQTSSANKTKTKVHIPTKR